MAWLPFSKPASPAPPASSVSIEQRSHSSLNLTKDSDIAHTLDRLSSPDTSVHVAEANSDAKKATTEFVAHRPKNMFVIDGEKDASDSIICTSDEQGNKTCLRLRCNLVELFKHMQHLEYFCSLPNDIDATYFECRKIT